MKCFHKNVSYNQNYRKYSIPIRATAQKRITLGLKVFRTKTLVSMKFEVFEQHRRSALSQPARQSSSTQTARGKDGVRYRIQYGEQVFWVYNKLQSYRQNQLQRES